MQSVNPATNEPIQRYEEATAEQCGRIVESVHEAWLDWRRTAFAVRAECLRRAAAILRDDSERWARLMTAEMGKPISAARAEVAKCALVCDYYADNGESFLQPEAVETEATSSYVCYRPLGVVLAVMPWNFPFWQVFRFAAPTLMAGNAIVLKHASNVPGCALVIQDIFLSAGFPPDLFRTLLVGSAQVEAIIAHPNVRAVTLTGSTEAGRAVAALAGRHLKKAVLELGGADPYVILEDADLEAAAAACVTGRLINAGQSCIAAKRWIVVEAVRERFTRLVLAGMSAAPQGDPFDDATIVGPLARTDLRDELHMHVRLSIAAGAKLLLGGQAPDRPGAWYPATVLDDVRPGMPAWEQELFGPVAVIIGAKDEADALRIANDSPFGLGAAVFTRDLARGERIAREELDAGACFVNAFVRSDPRLPFGGVKDSGYGRELGVHGIREFVNVKTVYVR
ncbi:MAG: NAD-dependent succinate-semialdehyde dehydrogenase [Candidatus Cloacimonetes bacterium]|nr:NAD-dependent succinate-semialdehyde dehydrogenase [Candidatus Cloacimonadota bacterium]